jgi:hypothetical protein
MQDPVCGLPRTPFPETVWKIAKEVLEGVRLVREDGKMELLHPLLLTEGTRTGGYADFPNSLSTTFVNTACTRSQGAA